MSRRIELALLTLVLLLAAVLRMGWPEITEFKRDEAALYSLALDVAEFKAFPLRGIGSSVGLPNTAISVYFFAIPLFVWKSPLAATLWVGLLNMAAVALTYFFVRRYFGTRAALLAALLYAAAPWAVIYSRKIWAQNLLPLFVVSYFFTAALTFVEGRRRWLVAHLLLLALIAQIHYSGLLFLPLTGALLIIFRRNIDWQMMRWGLLAALITAIPFLLYFAQNMGGTGGLSGLLNRPFQFSFESLQLAALVSMGTEIHSLAGPQEFGNYLATVPDFALLLRLGGVLTLAGVWLAIAHRASRTTQAVSRLILVWLILPPLAFLIHTTPVYPHYFIILFPAPFILAALALDAFIEKGLNFLEPAVTPALGWMLTLAIAGTQVWLFIALLNFIGTRATPGGFGTPLGQLLQVVQAVRGAPDVVVVSAGADPQFDEVPSIYSVLLRGTPHRFVDGRTTAVFPTGDSRVILWPNNNSPAEVAYTTLNISQAEVLIPLRQNEGQVRVLTFSGAAEQALAQMPQPREASALLSNFAEILGSGGNTQTWELWWRAPEGGENATLFAHVLDANGQRISQADVQTYPATYWRAGDLVVSYFAVSNAGPTVRAGMYQSVSLTPIEILDASGNPSGQWLEFPR